MPQPNCSRPLGYVGGILSTGRLAAVYAGAPSTGGPHRVAWLVGVSAVVHR